MYLPIYTNVAIFLGALVRKTIELFTKSEVDVEKKRENGILYSSGLVAGEGLVGVGIAFWAGIFGKPAGIGSAWLGNFLEIFSLIMFGILIFTIVRATSLKK